MCEHEFVEMVDVRDAEVEGSDEDDFGGRDVGEEMEWDQE